MGLQTLMNYGLHILIDLQTFYGLQILIGLQTFELWAAHINGPANLRIMGPNY